MIDYIYEKIVSLSNKSKKIKYCLPNYTNILYPLGYGWNHPPISFNNDINDTLNGNNLISIEIINNNIEITEKTTLKKSNVCTIFNIMYNIFIITLISWPLLYSIILSFIEYNFKHLTDNIYQLLFIAQYASGSIYFSQDHIYDILRSKIKKPFTFTFWMHLAAILCLIFPIITVILFNLDIEIVVYTNIYNKYPHILTKILLNIFMFVDKLICYLCFFVNMVTFSYIKIHNKNKINLFSKKLSDNGSNNFSHLINTVAEEFFKMRLEHNNTIKYLNYIFSTVNITGLIAIYFTLKNLNNKIYLIMEIINVFLFLIMELVYLYSINKVKNSIDNIKEVMISFNFITQIFNKSADITIIKKNNDHIIDELNSEISYHSKVSAISSSKSIETLNWMILKEILNTEWDSFKFLGFSITDTYIIQKIFGIVITFLIAKDISDGLSVL